jgi:hypothetical protein
VSDLEGEVRNIQRDNERFENYLRAFRPVAPEPAHLRKHRSAKRRSVGLAAWAATAALALLAALLALQHRPKPGPVPVVTNNPVAIDQLPPQQPLTLGSADLLLVKSPSFKAAIDALAAPTPSIENASGAHSALAVLSEYGKSKETTKP